MLDYGDALYAHVLLEESLQMDPIWVDDAPGTPLTFEEEATLRDLLSVVDDETCRMVLDQ